MLPATRPTTSTPSGATCGATSPCRLSEPQGASRGYSMPKPKRSWREKLADSKDLPKTIVLDGRAKAKWGEGVMVIPAPRDVDALMRKVPAKKIVTTTSLRSALARNASVDSACPITTGIFAWIAANAAGEDEADG